MDACNLCFYQHVLRPAGGEISPHSHGCHELVYYLSGAGTAALKGREETIVRGHYQFVPRGESHSEQHDQDTEVLFLGFHYLDDNLLPQPGIHADGRDAPVLKWMRRIVAEAREQPRLHQEMIGALLTALMVMIQRQQFPAVSRRSLQYAARFIRENYHESLSLKGLAADCGYRYDYFQHQFKREMGESPQQYLMRQRLENARRLLLGGNACSEAAYACGFSNAAQFSALFKRMYGLPPREYIRRAAEENLPAADPFPD